MSSSGSLTWKVRRWFDSKRILVQSDTERAILVIVAITVAVFLSGTYSGITSLESVWADQGHYADRCNNVTSASDPPILILPDAKCQAQALKLLLLSHAASTVTYIAIPITGILTDWQGARRVFGGVLVLLTIGNLIAIIPGYWTQFVGTTIMSAMGPCLAFNLLVWAQLVPGWTRWVVAIITAAFPGGSFFLGNLRAAIMSGHFSISTFFALWLIVTIPSLYLFIIWPRGIGKPYAASHPLLMLAYFDIVKKIMQMLHIPIPEDVDAETVVELENVYTSDDGSTKRAETPTPEDDTVRLDFDAPHRTASVNSMDTPTSESPAPASMGDNHVIPLDTSDGLQPTPRPKAGIKAFKWLDQLNSFSIVLLQAYFLVVCVWLALVANLGAYRMAYWARKTGGTTEGIAQNVHEAKMFLSLLDIIGVVSIGAAPIAAIVMKSVGAAGTAIIVHTVATIAALLCLSSSFGVQLLNFFLFPVIRGLMYPFAMMFLIQTCGRRHLGLLWALTVSGASPTDFIRTILVKYWLSHTEAWDVLNGVQLVLIAIGWIWPVYVWINRGEWEEGHPEPLS